MKNNVLSRIKHDLSKLGIVSGDVVLMHSSYKSLGSFEGGARVFFGAFKEVLGESGTLILPALSYEYVTRNNPVFDVDNTKSCVGYLSEFFRTNVDGVVRSIHPTHSCCAWGKYADEITRDHHKDCTPVGANSPFSKLPDYDGKILMLGCGTNCNTSMHGVEETVEPIYCIDRDNPLEYTLVNGGKVIRQKAFRHLFRNKNNEHVQQCYYRITSLLCEEDISVGNVLGAKCYLMKANALWKVGRQKLLDDSFYFVDYPKD